MGQRLRLTSSPDRPTTPGAADALLFRLFAAAWSLAALFHTEYHWLAWHEPAPGPRLTALALTAAALATLARPGTTTFTALVVAQLADVLVLLPEVSNHWLLAALVNVAWLLARPGARGAGGWLVRARAPILASVAVFYLWTGVWKLNADFLRPEVSCAAAAWERVLGFFRWLPDAGALRAGVVAGTLVAELVGPLLLLVPRTRGIAVVALVLFHLLLGVDAIKRYLNFSSVMFALLLLWLPDAAALRLRELVPSGARLRRLAAAAYVALIAASIAAGPDVALYLVGRWFLWLLYATALLVLVTLAVATAPRATRVLPPGSRGSLAWVVPALVLANGLSPLLGVKTRSSWQMYSNIRLEAETSNHLLFGPSLDLLGALADRVTVVASTADSMRDVAGSGLELPWTEFRRRLLAAPAASVTYVYRGERRTVARVADDPALSAPLPVAARKLLFFRAVGPGVETRCEW